MCDPNGLNEYTAVSFNSLSRLTLSIHSLYSLSRFDLTQETCLRTMKARYTGIFQNM